MAQRRRHRPSPEHEWRPGLVDTADDRGYPDVLGDRVSSPAGTAPASLGHAGRRTWTPVRRAGDPPSATTAATAARRAGSGDPADLAHGQRPCSPRSRSRTAARQSLWSSATSETTRLASCGATTAGRSGSRRSGRGLRRGLEGVPTTIPVVAAADNAAVAVASRREQRYTARTWTAAGDHLVRVVHPRSGFSTAAGKGNRLAVGGTTKEGPWVGSGGHRRVGRPPADPRDHPRRRDGERGQSGRRPERERPGRRGTPRRWTSMRIPPIREEISPLVRVARKRRDLERPDPDPPGPGAKRSRMMPIARRRVVLGQLAGSGSPGCTRLCVPVM